ncbi:MAG: DUF885 domain-containing protein [Pseudomonadota bacterium]
MPRSLTLFSALFVLSWVSPATADPERLADVAERHAMTILKTYPEWATQLGVSEARLGESVADQLTGGSAEANAAVRETLAELRREWSAFDPAALTTRERVTHQVVDHAYALAERHNATGVGQPVLLAAGPPYVVNQLFGPHVDVPRLLMAQHPIYTAANAESWIARLSALPGALDEMLAMAKADAANGVVPPAFILETVERGALAYIASTPEEHRLCQHFAARLGSLDDLGADKKAALADQCLAVLTDDLFPAYQRFADGVAALTPDANEQAGLSGLPNGEALYRLALDAWGATGLSADEIHALGIDEVARIHKEMDTLLCSVGYSDGSVGERMQALAKDPAHARPNTDAEKKQVIAELQADIERVLAITPEWFSAAPKYDVEVRRIAPHEEATASGGYYTPPTLDGSRPGVFWVNLKDLAETPAYTLRSLAFHEAVPGHHFQASAALAIGNAPLLQSMLWFGDYGEGWALYAEALAHEMGLYENDPLGDLGRLRMELYRAVRLVVDTGLHARGWSREQAIDYMVAATGEPRDPIIREVERYVVWPGQATSYKIGMLQLQRFRADAEQALGEHFDLAAFHDVVLNGGAMPMAVLRQEVDRWVSEQQAAIAATTVPLLTEACESSLALSAAPEYLREGAGVWVLTADGFRETQSPTNPFTCVVNRDDPRVLKPTCYDAEGARNILPKVLWFGESLLAGRAVEAIRADVKAGFESGRFERVTQPGVAYMLSRYNRPVNRQTGELGFFPPHVMFYAPDLTNNDIGHDMRFHDPAQPLPMIAYGGPHGYMIMISDDGTPRSRSDLDASCPDWVFAE